MTRLVLFASMIALGRGTAMFHSSRYSNLPSVNIRQNTGAAFRDGLFVGRIAAERGIPPHVLTGRWATEADRASFKAGYLQGYEQTRTNRAAHY
jgi:hypothetical protein